MDDEPAKVLPFDQSDPVPICPHCGQEINEVKVREFPNQLLVLSCAVCHKVFAATFPPVVVQQQQTKSPIHRLN